MYEKLSEKFEKKIAQWNQGEILIQNLYVYPASQALSYGEARGYKKETIEPEDSIVERLTEHIYQLAVIANEFQQKNLANKKSGEEIITRILMPEFALYSEKPLTTAEYNQLLDNLKERLKDFSNIHLLLSSIAVQTEDNRLLNTVCYIECRDKMDPKMTSVSKRWSSGADITYEKTLKPFEPFGIETEDVNLYKMNENESLHDIPSQRAFVLQGNTIYFIDKQRDLVLPLLDDVSDELKGNLIRKFEEILNSAPSCSSEDALNKEDYELFSQIFLYETEKGKLMCALSGYLEQLATPENIDAASLVADYKDGLLISNLALFQVEIGDKRYWQGIEVCTEHPRLRLPTLAKQLVEGESEELLADRVDHLLTSNTTSAGANKVVPVAEQGKITHIDPSIRIKNTEGIIVNNTPAFGPQYYVVPGALEKVCHFSEQLMDKLKTHNARVIDKKIKAILGENPEQAHVEKEASKPPPLPFFNHERMKQKADRLRSKRTDDTPPDDFQNKM